AAGAGTFARRNPVLHVIVLIVGGAASARPVVVINVVVSSGHVFLQLFQGDVAIVVVDSRIAHFDLVQCVSGRIPDNADAIATTAVLGHQLVVRVVNG